MTKKYKISNGKKTKLEDEPRSAKSKYRSPRRTGPQKASPQRAAAP